MDLNKSTEVKYIKHNAIPSMGHPEVTTIQVTQDDGQICSVPMADDNVDYQEILAWVAEGNTIEPADE